MMVMNRLSVALGLAAAVAGCGLISTDVTRVGFMLPDQTFTVDTSTFNLASVSTVAVPCGDGQVVTDCCNPPAPSPTPDCTATPLVCAAYNGQNVCTAQIPWSFATTVDLSNQFSSPASSVLKDVQITKITYTVSNNTLNVDLPALTIYLAPKGVSDTSSATEFGTVPSIPAGTDPSANVELVSNANQVFQQYAANPSVPFNVIVATTLVIPSGTPVPSGHATITIGGTLTTQL
jgi:hypothetical protein